MPAVTKQRAEALIREFRWQCALRKAQDWRDGLAADGPPTDDAKPDNRSSGEGVQAVTEDHDATSG